MTSWHPITINKRLRISYTYLHLACIVKCQFWIKVQSPLPLSYSHSFNRTTCQSSRGNTACRSAPWTFPYSTASSRMRKQSARDGTSGTWRLCIVPWQVSNILHTMTLVSRGSGSRNTEVPHGRRTIRLGTAGDNPRMTHKNSFIVYYRSINIPIYEKSRLSGRRKINKTTNKKKYSIFKPILAVLHFNT